MAEHAELELAQRYAARTLSADEAAAFEDHMVGCDECQAEVKLTAGVRRLARDLREHGVAARASTKRFVGAVVLLAAGFALVMLMPRGTDPALAALGHVSEPPAYVGVNVRAAKQLGDSLFDAAMTSYVARNYDDAAAGLRAALAAGVDSVPATFFMASADLMSGRVREASDEYARVIAKGAAASAYLPEAHIYKARALLQLGRRDEALAELNAVSRSDPTSGPAMLADSISRALRR